jgi:hypothetical protein
MLIEQAVHTLKTGSVAWFFLDNNPPSRGASRRYLLFGSFYALVAIFLISFALRAFINSTELRARLMANPAQLLVSCLSAVMGLWTIIHPTGVLGWVQRDNPQLQATDTLLWIIRAIGIVVLVSSIYLFSFI